MRIVEVETRTVEGQSTALGAAGGATAVVDLPSEAGGSGRGFGEEELLCLAVAASLTGAVMNLVRRAASVRRGRVEVRSEFPVRTLEEVLAVCRFMARWDGPWWVAGGWAIDLWAGGQSREHEDIELAVPRRDQAALRVLVADWGSYTPKQLRWAPMDAGEVLAAPGAMWQRRRTPDTRVPVAGMPSRWEFVLSEIEGGEWRFARDPSVRLPLERVVVRSPLGPPVASPEIVLLHKAFNDPPRPKDEHDFLWVRDRLSAEQRGWLRAQLERVLPAHRWLPQLG